MQKTDKLIDLIEQAASAINMLSPTDLSELERLQTILDQINRAIAEISEGPAELLEEAKGTTSGAAEMLQKILQQEVEDTTQSIEAVSQAVSALQSLIEQVTEAGTGPDIEPAEADLPASVKTVPQEAYVIPE